MFGKSVFLKISIFILSLLGLLGFFYFEGIITETMTPAYAATCRILVGALDVRGNNIPNKTITSSSGQSCTTDANGNSCPMDLGGPGSYTLSSGGCQSLAIMLTAIDCNMGGYQYLRCGTLAPMQCQGSSCVPCTGATCLYNCTGTNPGECSVVTPPPSTRTVDEPTCRCPGGCCPAQVSYIDPLVNPRQPQDPCANPSIGTCLFPNAFMNKNSLPEPYIENYWRTTPDDSEYDCNPWIWNPPGEYNQYVYRYDGQGSCPNISITPGFISTHPTATCTYPVPSQNYVKTNMETCNQPVSRAICSRSSGMMSTTSCPGTSYVSYLRKLNQCCDPARNVWAAGGNQAICSATTSPDSRCSACSGATGVRCVDGRTDVCRKAIEVQTFETRSRSITPPTGASCAACIERQVNGQKMTCGSPETCRVGETCSTPCADPLDPAGYSCNGTTCCGSCDPVYDCQNYVCNTNPTTNVYPYHREGCGDSNGLCSSGCANDEVCCNVQNQQGGSMCTNPPGGCKDNLGNAVCPGGCLVEWNRADPLNPVAVCEAAINTPCGPCCNGPKPTREPAATFCGENISQQTYFPPEATQCTYYESTVRESMYTVKYDSNRVKIAFNVSNLSNHRLYDVRATMQIPDFLDYFCTNYSPGYGSHSLFCGDGTRIDGDSCAEELANYKAKKCHGGYVNWHFNNFTLRDYYRANPSQCPRCIEAAKDGLTPEEDALYCQTHYDPVEGIYTSCMEHMVSYPGDKLPDNTSLVSSFVINLELTPSDIDSQGTSYYEDHCIGNSEIEHYTNNLISDDRLANLEMKVFWPGSNPETGEEGRGVGASRVIEPMAFWIGKGVKSTAGPTCSGSVCFVDPDSRPFGWPTFGRIAEDWGGAADIASAAEVTWTNPLAAENAWDIANKASRLTLPDGKQNGEYLSGCGDVDPTGMGWKHVGITIVPTEGKASPPYVYSTQAGYITHVGYNSLYPGRGYYVEIGSSVDDDCQYNYVSRYGNLRADSVRVTKGQYVPRHKILGIMGDTGDTGALRALGGPHMYNTGLTRTLYQIRYGMSVDDFDDNNVYNPGTQTSCPYPSDGSCAVVATCGSTPCCAACTSDDTLRPVDPAPIGDPLYNPNFTEPDDICRNSASCGSDTCYDNPYICEWSSYQYYGPCHLLGEGIGTVTNTQTGTGTGFNPVFFCENRRDPETVSRCYYANP